MGNHPRSISRPPSIVLIHKRVHLSSRKQQRGGVDMIRCRQAARGAAPRSCVGLPCFTSGAFYITSDWTCMGFVGVKSKVRMSCSWIVHDKPELGARRSEESSPSRRDYRATNLYPVGSV